MTQEGFNRKLTTIFSADAVGYSRLTVAASSSPIRTIELYP